MATGARRPSLARIGAGPEPIKALLDGEEESNHVAKHSDLEASLPQTFPHPAAATRRDVLRSTLIPLQLAGDVDDQGKTLDRCAGDADELQLASASPLAGRSVRRPSM